MLEGGRSRRIGRTGAADGGLPSIALGVPEADSALLVPMHYRRNAIGVLAAFDTGRPGEQFSIADEQLLRTFAALGRQRGCGQTQRRHRASARHDRRRRRRAAPLGQGSA